MSDVLKKHIDRFVVMNDSEFSCILPLFKSLHPKKKEDLLKEGQVCKFNYFVVKGCLRMYFVNEKGIEQTIQFAIENWWMSDYFSFEKKQVSEFNIQAVENCEILAIDYTSQEKMLEQFPVMERYFRMIHQRARSAADFRLKFLYGFSREALYHQFSSQYPEFIQRVPQYLLASFLGFTPEYLSEIRSKKLS